MITIKVKRNENINRVLSKFKAAVMAEGIMKTVKEKSHFVKPCIQKRLKSKNLNKLHVDYGYALESIRKNLNSYQEGLKKTYKIISTLSCKKSF